MIELRFSSCISRIALILSFINLIRLYVQASFLWIPNGLTLILIYLAIAIDDQKLRRFSYSISIPKIIQGISWLLILLGFFSTCISALTFLFKDIELIDSTIYLFTNITIIILLIGTHIGIYQKIISTIR